MVKSYKYKCIDCGITMEVHKKRTCPVGHVKHMYCYTCSEMKPFVQVYPDGSLPEMIDEVDQSIKEKWEKIYQIYSQG